MGASVPSRRRLARGRELAVVSSLQEDDAAVGVHELEERRRIFSSSFVDVALEADVARELPREAEALVVGAELAADRARC